MYKIDLLDKNHNWIFFYENESIKEIDKVVWKLINLRPNKYLRVCKDNEVLVFINGTLEHYNYWKEKYVRQNIKRLFRR